MALLCRPKARHSIGLCPELMIREDVALLQFYWRNNLNPHLRKTNLRFWSELSHSGRTNSQCVSLLALSSLSPHMRGLTWATLPQENTWDQNSSQGGGEERERLTCSTSQFTDAPVSSPHKPHNSRSAHSSRTKSWIKLVLLFHDLAYSRVSARNATGLIVGGKTRKRSSPSMINPPSLGWPSHHHHISPSLSRLQWQHQALEPSLY